jgi:Chorismate synthase
VVDAVARSPPSLSLRQVYFVGLSLTVPWDVMEGGGHLTGLRTIVLSATAMSTYGTLFRVTTYGESHCASVGAIVDGCPPVRPASDPGASI